MSRAGISPYRDSMLKRSGQEMLPRPGRDMGTGWLVRGELRGRAVPCGRVTAGAVKLSSMRKVITWADNEAVDLRFLEDNQKRRHPRHPIRHRKSQHTKQ